MRCQGARAVGVVAIGTVIVYHGVGAGDVRSDPYRMLMPVSRFRWQMEFLARHREVVALDQLLAGGGGGWLRPAVAITFDDGYLSVLQVAAPILAEHGFVATAFVPTEWLGRDKGWDPLDGQATPLPIMTAEQLVELQRLGHRVESHGHRHRSLAGLTFGECRAELLESKRTLHAVLNRAPAFLAYPFGHHSLNAEAAARAAGFEGAFSIGQPGGSTFDRERVTVRPTDGRALFAYKTSGRYLATRSAPVIAQGYRVAHPMVRWARNRRAVLQ